MNIWWLSDRDIAAIGRPSIKFPPYLHRQFVSICGRPKHGRLWCDIEIGLRNTVSATIPPTPLGRLISEHYGGIVIESQHAHLVHHLPGILTDMD